MRLRLALLSLSFLLVPSLSRAQADDRVAVLGKQLISGKDPRVRSRAAQRLGASDDPEAVRPLCTALEDPSEVVRAEAARGLGKLQEVSALDCLRAREEDADAVAKAAIREAIRTIEAFKDRTPSLYIAIGPVKDRTGTLSPELVRLTEQRLARRLVQSGAKLAPRGETKAAARDVLKKRGLPGYLLMAEIHPTESGGLRLSLVCLSYPERALLGQVDVQASGAEPSELLKALVPRIVEEAAETFEWSN